MSREAIALISSVAPSISLLFAVIAEAARRVPAIAAFLSRQAGLGTAPVGSVRWVTRALPFHVIEGLVIISREAEAPHRTGDTMTPITLWQC